MNTKNRCGDCKHYAFARNPKTNRPLPSMDGNCTYPVEWPVLPKAFLAHELGGWCRVSIFELPKRQHVSKNDEFECAVFEAAAGEKRNGQEPPL